MENLKKKIEFILSLYKSKKLAEAETLNKKLIAAYPNVEILYNILGLIFTGQNKIEEAIQIYNKGIEIKPDYAVIYNNLGSVYKIKKNYVQAERYFKKSIDLDRNAPEAQNNLGNLYLTLNKNLDAIACYKKAIIINPKFFIAHYNLAAIYKTHGEFEKAKNHLKKATSINMFFCTAHRILSQITKYTKKDDHFVLLKKLFNDNRISSSEKSEVAFALGKACDDIKDFKTAFDYYKEGNLLRRKNLLFSIEDEIRQFDNIKKTFNKKIFKRFNKPQKSDFSPIFIIGMPRSGTTLVEQILSSHHDVFGGDELFFLPNLVKKYFSDDKLEFSPSKIAIISDFTLDKIGKEYINNLKNLSNNAKRTTDKLPINFKWIGLIKLILPNSKIVNCVRNPKDNCLSIFKTYFTNPKLNFAYDLNEISKFYFLYDNLMKHWKSTLPKFIYDMQYEKLVSDPKKQTQNLLKYCNLSWDNKCIKFYNNKRVIRTASDVQARKKMYQSSVHSWKNYKLQLQKFFQKLPG